MEWNAAAGMNNVGVANGSNLHRRDAVVKLRQGREGDEMEQLGTA